MKTQPSGAWRVVPLVPLLFRNINNNYTLAIHHWGYLGSTPPQTATTRKENIFISILVKPFLAFHPRPPQHSTKNCLLELVVSTHHLKNISQIWESSPNRAGNSKKYLKPPVSWITPCSQKLASTLSDTLLQGRSWGQHRRLNRFHVRCRNDEVSERHVSGGFYGI